MIREQLMVVHRWLALVVAVVLVATAVSGSLLVFEGAIDRALNPRLWRVDPAGRNTTLPIDTLVTNVEATLPKSKVGSVGIAPVADRAWTLNAGGVSAFVDPYTGAIKGVRTQAESQATLARRLHVFHVELFAGPKGREIVGAITAVALFLIVTGIVLWWPDKLVRVNTRASWKRINFDLHHMLGIAASLVLILITASALVIHYDALTRVVKSLDSAPPPPTPAQPAAPSASAPRPSLDAIASTARMALPGARLLSISLGSPKTPIVAGMRFPEDHTPGGRSRVFLDRYTGATLGVVSTREAALGTRLDNLKRSMHTGDILGRPSEAVWLVASLVMVAQVMTGLMMWWNARRGRRRPTGLAGDRARYQP